MIETTELFDAAMAAGLIYDSTVTFNGILKTSKAGLILNDFTPTKTTVLADITQPTYAGYATILAAFTGPSRDATGKLGVDSALITFQMDDDVIPTQPLGWFLVNTAGTGLLMMEFFADGAQPLVDEYSFVSFVIRLDTANPEAGTATLIK